MRKYPNSFRTSFFYSARILVLFLMVQGIFISCEKENPIIKGQVTLSSKFDFTHGTVSGYLFEQQEFVNYPSSESVQPDIVVDQFRMLDGSMKAGFTSPGNLNGFALVQEFSTLDNSLAYYGQYSQADTSMQFSPASDTVKQYQVWLLKTASDHYVKIHVRDVNLFEDMAGSYLTVFIDYYCQQDGTLNFP